MGKAPNGLSLTPEQCREYAKTCCNLARAEHDQAKRKELEDIATMTLLAGGRDLFEGLLEYDG